MLSFITAKTVLKKIFFFFKHPIDGGERTGAELGKKMATLKKDSNF